MSTGHLRKAVLICAMSTLLAACGDHEPQREGPGPFAASGGPEPATVWAIGDASDTGERARAVAKLVARERPDRLLYLGDVYESGTAEEFKVYDDLYGALGFVTAPTPGNHEWPAHSQGYDPYWTAIKGRRPPRRYSFSLAGWEIISLNSELGGAHSTEQVRWLRRRVAGPGTCRLAFWHQPRYSAGTVHGDQPSTHPLWKALSGKAALVVNGHEHDMQRMKPRDGIVEVISGAGGHGDRYPVREDDERLTFADDDHDGALRIRLRRGRAQLDFVATDGRVLDSSIVSCRP